MSKTVYCRPDDLRAIYNQAGARTLLVSAVPGGDFTVAMTVGDSSDCALIPIEPDDALLRPFHKCHSGDLALAWAAMHRVAAVRMAVMTQPQQPQTKPLDDPRLQELFMSAITGAMTFGFQGANKPPEGHWLNAAWDIGRAEAERNAEPAQTASVAALSDVDHADRMSMAPAVAASLAAAPNAEEIRADLKALYDIAMQIAEAQPAAAPVVPAGKNDYDFLQGICVALQHIKQSDSVAWREIVQAAGERQLLEYAALIEPDEWELAGFDKLAMQELGERKPKSRRAKLATPVAPAEPTDTALRAGLDAFAACPPEATTIVRVAAAIRAALATPAPALAAAEYPVLWIVRHRNDTPYGYPAVHYTAESAQAHADQFLPGVARVVALVEAPAAPTEETPDQADRIRALESELTQLRAFRDAVRGGMPTGDTDAKIAEALSHPACERLREWVAIGPAQRAAVGSLVDLVAGPAVPAGYWLALYANICTDMERDQEAWIAALRAAGVKAAHPDDGWVNRKDNYVQFVYPQFNDGAKAGDLVALGWPQWRSAKPQHRIVRLVEFHRSTFGAGSWKFEPANVGGEARLAAHQPSHTTTATPQGVASTDQLGGCRPEREDDEQATTERCRESQDGRWRAVRHEHAEAGAGR